MMKIITMFFAVFFCCQNTATKEIVEKAKKLRAKLLYGKSLPPIITKPGSFLGHKIDESFFYNTERKENNFVDSILMIVSIYLEDSLEHILSFNEVHLKNNETYMYKFNK